MQWDQDNYTILQSKFATESPNELCGCQNKNKAIFKKEQGLYSDIYNNNNNNNMKNTIIYC